MVEARGLEAVRQSNDRLGVAEKQEPTRPQHRSKIGDGPAKGALREVNQRIAAEEHVVSERLAVACQVHDVAVPKGDASAKLLPNSVPLVGLAFQIPVDLTLIHIAQ